MNRHHGGNGRPVEAARPCPNCGRLSWASELVHSSTRTIKAKNGEISSTLYGVCKECAKTHSL